MIVCSIFPKLSLGTYLSAKLRFVWWNGKRIFPVAALPAEAVQLLG